MVGCCRNTKSFSFSESYSSYSKDSSPDHTTGIFEGVPKDGGIVDGEFEICDRPHLPTYNLPVMQNDELTSGYVSTSLLGTLKIEPRVKLL